MLIIPLNYIYVVQSTVTFKCVSFVVLKFSFCLTLSHTSQWIIILKVVLNTLIQMVYEAYARWPGRSSEGIRGCQSETRPGNPLGNLQNDTGGQFIFITNNSYFHRKESSLQIVSDFFIGQFYLEPPVKLGEELDKKKIDREKFFTLRHGQVHTIGQPIPSWQRWRHAADVNIVFIGDRALPLRI